MSEFFIELFSEEIPARMQADAAEHVKKYITDALTKHELKYDEVYSFVASRRVGLVVKGLPVSQADLVEERKGPSVTSPEQALNGFLKSTGLTKDQLVTKETPKGTFYFANVSHKGRPTTEVLQETVSTMLTTFPWPKSMRWASHAEHWVRPLHSMICLFDSEVISVEFAGVKSSNKTSGHRFLAPASFEVKNFEDYAQKIRNAFVIIDPEERKKIISEKAHELAKSAGYKLLEDAGLLNEVAGLAEYPVCLMGKIDDEFMSVPQEVLITSMRTNQKYFCMTDDNGKMAPRFVVVSNMKTDDNGAQIIAGNERVLRARLSDARFFWDEDRKQKLIDKADRLSARVFHAKLGSVQDKIERMRALMPAIVKYIPGAKIADADRACLLCKADLSTGMVGEFPELQGIMGRYYAVHDGENDAVCSAIAEHYSPLGPNDTCPSKPTSIAVALADKIDTLVGFWLIDLKPTGSKDPFALRRAALGVIRLIVENKINLPLMQVFDEARAVYGDSIQSSVQEAMTKSEKRDENGEPTVLVNWSVRQMYSLMSFIAERLKVAMKDKGVRHDYISAVYNLGRQDDFQTVDLVKVLTRVDALTELLDSADGADLLTAYRRAGNILRIESAKDKQGYDETADKTKFILPEETTLFDALGKIMLNSSSKIASNDFKGAMAVLAELREPVDAFFDKVQVNCEDVGLRANRLRLLSMIVKAMNAVADFSVIEG
ncbi:MAG: glycine--tRNA ligase subunit beta [Alphaproteobacteria bacterium]|nr:glycine--tRNA ligase subunit beta [Alphaproteobacteria bacterium]